MGLQDRDYYGEKYWKLIEEEDKKPPQPPRIEKIYRPNFGFGRKWNQFLNFLKNIFSLIGLVWLILFITNYFHAPKPLSSKPPVSISESKQITSEEKENIWRIGETIRRGNFEYTLNWVKIMSKWVNRCYEYGCYKYEPKDGFKFVVVSITAKNIGIEKNSPTDWSIIVKTSDGVFYKDLEAKYMKYGFLEGDATQEEAEKYYCPELNTFLSSIYPQETITGCKSIGIHENKEPIEILFNWGVVSQERPDYIIKLK